MQLSIETVRLAVLAAQALLTPPKPKAQKIDLLPMIQKMGYLQIDTIQVVRRSQYLVLWSRLGDYHPAWLDQIHAEGDLFEYFAHALCYLPIEHYPILRGLMLYDDRIGNEWQEWAAKHADVVNHVREVVRQKGPVCSADFNSPGIADGWGNVKQEKHALSRMWSTGELMVPYRKKFRRYFDLRERVLPDWDDKDALDRDAAREILILKTVQALGAAREEWVAPYYYLHKTGLLDTLSRLVSEGKLHQMQVKGWDLPVYIHPDHLEMIESVARGKINPSHTTFLSPFDPLLSDRKRTQSLFDFDLKLEAYTPAKDRQYGYFCLPILHEGRLVGRLDPKAHRNEKQMEIKKIIMEPSVEIDRHLVSALRDTLEKFTHWHGMSSYVISDSQPKQLLAVLK